MCAFGNYSQRMAVQSTLSTTNSKEAIKQSVADQFQTMPTFFECKVIYADGQSEILGFQSLKDTKDDKILMHPDHPVPVGTIILDYKDRDWIVTRVDFTGDVLRTGYLVEVNYELKWLNKDTNQIVSTPSAVNLISRKAMQSEDSFMVLPVGQREIIVPKNQNTESLKMAGRLAIDKRYFEIIEIDAFSFPGCLIFTTEEDLKSYNDTEDVADGEEVVPDFDSLEIRGEDFIVRGDSLIYTLSVGNGLPVTGGTWSIENNFANATGSLEVDSYVVEAPWDAAYVGKTFDIKVVYESMEYIKTVTVKSFM